ncbi:MAG: D-glycerate 3-kinase [Kiritimatiellia bacterium]|jgi:D-glycerate 3-kinase
MDKVTLLLEDFCRQHQLPNHYPAMAKQWFVPLARQIAAMPAIQNTGIALVGINGCQGSGKSTLAALLKDCLYALHKKNALILSIDDFYLTRQARYHLAQKTHPLFITRGVPGTHDIALLSKCIQQLQRQQYPVDIPRFDKAADDRLAKEQWDTVTDAIDIILLEGWCVGSPAQPVQALLDPINPLEDKEDSERRWRNTSNQLLANDYQQLFHTLDTLIMLKAPSFDCVFQWRKTQEDKLQRSTKNAQSQNSLMDDNSLIRFIQHYQRITEHTLATLPQSADIVFALNHQQQVIQRQDNL